MARYDNPRPDGRALRSAGTRSAVAQAYLDLVQEGSLRPTARQIADRAEVSERAVFRHFQDLETLLAEAARLQIERVGAAVPPPAPVEGPIGKRLEAFVARWSELNERVTPVRRVALLHEPFSPEVARRLAWIRGVLRRELEATFEPELGGLPSDKHRQAVAALCATSSWATWEELRTRHELGPEAARRTVERALTALIDHMGSV